MRAFDSIWRDAAIEQGPSESWTPWCVVHDAQKAGADANRRGVCFRQLEVKPGEPTRCVFYDATVTWEWKRGGNPPLDTARDKGVFIEDVTVELTDEDDLDV